MRIEERETHDINTLREENPRVVNGLKVYGTRPDPGKMAARGKRDRVRMSNLRPVLWKRRSNPGYYVEAYATPAGTRTVCRGDHGEGKTELPTYWCYAMRRDGRIERSWVPVDETVLVFEPCN